MNDIMLVDGSTLDGPTRDWRWLWCGNFISYTSGKYDNGYHPHDMAYSAQKSKSVCKANGTHQLEYDVIKIRSANHKSQTEILLAFRLRETVDGRCAGQLVYHMLRVDANVHASCTLANIVSSVHRCCVLPTTIILSRMNAAIGIYPR